MNVLFFSVSIGAGHNKAAEAVREELHKKYPQSKTMIVDTLKYINPVIDKLVVSGYLNALKNTPLLYKKLYEMADNGENINDFSKVINHLMSFRIKKLIREFKPDLLVCTHPFPLQMLSEMKRKKKLSLPVVAILTDFITHTFWLQPNVDRYFVAHDFMKNDMVRKGIDESIICSSGIPTSHKFREKKNRKDLLKTLGVEDMPTYLIMGGGLGIGQLDETIEALMKLEDNIQIVVIVGKNMKLKESILSMAESYTKKIKVITYTSKVSEWMSIADVIFTKPGGMTISEALCKNIPIVIISPIPGQEEKNSNFLVNLGAALRVFDKEDIHLILGLLKNKERMNNIIEAQKLLARPGAASNIINTFREVL